MLAVALILGGLVACGGEPAPVRPIKFLHTFNARETELFNTTIAERGLVVDASLVPFARGHQVITELLRAGADCPDLIRIDATWLPGLVAGRLLAAPPAELASAPWSAIGKELATADGALWAVPQAIDGLVVVRLASTPAPRAPAVAELAAAATRIQAGGLAHPLGVRVDGYWLVPWLRSEGVELAPAGIGGTGGGTGGGIGGAEEVRAVRALRDFAALFGGLAAPPPPAGSEAPDELRRWNAHELAYWVTGPWQLADLRDRDQIEVSALEHAPRGGQLLVVPACAKQPAEGWRLAKELTSEQVSLIFSDAFATIPTLEPAQGHATPLVQRTLAALATAERLPRVAVTPLLFDDLNPAVAAVVAGDATPEEAVAGVRRGWHRLEARQ
jgi:ABC-type glycerol-3-phosphate transport system substrate-binding protein